MIDRPSRKTDRSVCLAPSLKGSSPSYLTVQVYAYNSLCVNSILITIAGECVHNQNEPITYQHPQISSQAFHSWLKIISLVTWSTPPFWKMTTIGTADREWVPSSCCCIYCKLFDSLASNSAAKYDLFLSLNQLTQTGGKFERLCSSTATVWSIDGFLVKDRNIFDL